MTGVDIIVVTAGVVVLAYLVRETAKEVTDTRRRVIALQKDTIQIQAETIALLQGDLEEDDGPVMKMRGDLARFRDFGATVEVDVDQATEIEADDGTWLGIIFPDDTWIGGRN